MAWDLKDTTVIDEGVLQKHGGFIKPCAWLLSPTNKRLISYEFYFHHNNATNNVTYSQTTLLYLTAEFVDEFAEILHQDSLTGVLGVCYANISVPATDDTGFGPLNSIEAIWNYKVNDDDDSPPLVGL
ncbi:hypothetical protein CEP54_014215 [Fusarium duplospermum]|uniref:Uncharacterized protein n=1 Tax=Fusarium duplospermum TaxID=1325734 RepID=A0A428NXY6_9HYPO|nr:hypothetical protein CEP54_014215 [Fusarium duplospermum]